MIWRRLRVVIKAWRETTCIYDGRTSHLSEGSWSILRVHDSLQKDLKVLPGNGEKEFKKKVKKTLCPKGAPVKNFSVVAINKALKFNPNTEDEIEVDFERKLILANAEWQNLRS